MDINVEAKNHYVALLKKCMTPIMTETFVEMYKEAITRGKGNRDATMKNFAVLLEEVTNWNNSIISTHSKEYTNACTYFSDLLAAVFVCYVKILSTVRLTKDSKKINVKLPTNDNFIHACINNAAKEFIKHTYIFREQDAVSRNRKIRDVCAESIQHTLDELIPIQAILRTFMNADTSQFEIGDQQEPEPEATEEEEQEESPDAEEEEPTTTGIPAEPLPPPPPPMPLQQPQQPDTKQIPIRPEFNRPPLFPDAPDSREKIMHQQ